MIYCLVSLFPALWAWFLSSFLSSSHFQRYALASWRFIHSATFIALSSKWNEIHANQSFSLQLPLLSLSPPPLARFLSLFLILSCVVGRAEACRWQVWHLLFLTLTWCLLLCASRGWRWRNLKLGTNKNSVEPFLWSLSKLGIRRFDVQWFQSYCIFRFVVNKVFKFDSCLVRIVKIDSSR